MVIKWDGQEKGTTRGMEGARKRKGAAVDGDKKSTEAMENDACTADVLRNL